MSESKLRAVQVRHVVRGVARRHERPSRSHPGAAGELHEGAVLLQALATGVPHDDALQDRTVRR